MTDNPGLELSANQTGVELAITAAAREITPAVGVEFERDGFHSVNHFLIAAKLGIDVAITDEALVKAQDIAAVVIPNVRAGALSLQKAAYAGFGIDKIIDLLISDIEEMAKRSRAAAAVGEAMARKDFSTKLAITEHNAEAAAYSETARRIRAAMPR